MPIQKADIVPELMGIYRLSAIITIILFAYILTFVYKLESTGCECAKDWRKGYIIAYSIYFIAHALLQVLSPGSQILYALTPLTFAAGILFVVFTLQYVHRLKNEKCECSNKIGRVILYLVAAIDGAVFALYGLMIVIGGIMLALKR